MNYSYWELKHWFTKIDFAIVGSGIVGINCALQLRKNHPKSKIVIFERGLLPQGASTKNAGFACFGSVTEILDDLNRMSQDEVLTLIEKRWKGIQEFKNKFNNIDYQNYGGYELFYHDDELYTDNICFLNKLLCPIFNDEVFSLKDNLFGFKRIKNQLIFNQFESQIDTGKMMHEYLKLAHDNNILILNNCKVDYFEDVNSHVEFNVNDINVRTSKLLIATNGFAHQLLSNDVKPARAQVLITKPIKDLKIKGTFHLDKGYYYFRNINNRILLGGGRNLAFDEETTTEMTTTNLIQQHLEALLKNVILPDNSFEIDYSWAGIMGVGSSKVPIVKPISNNIFCGVRLGGMGVAIGAQTGRELADLLE